MSALRLAARTRPEPPLLDEEVWDAPRRLSDDDLFDHISPGWRRSGRPPEDPENDR